MKDDNRKNEDCLWFSVNKTNTIGISTMKPWFDNCNLWPNEFFYNQKNSAITLSNEALNYITLQKGMILKCFISDKNVSGKKVLVGFMMSDILVDNGLYKILPGAEPHRVYYVYKR